ncbi:SDR family NAD(P)-dependent oxidoreductase [Paraburkholderia sp.]|uniref:SDR family NAD(P)-dependent oxidoreductase n=1 Tax=Paraburkholderia sp. TaxID=1926495 RepID=UPI0039E6CF7A
MNLNPHASPRAAKTATLPRIALVTGGGSGIGAAISQQLAENGHIVFIGDINPHASRDLAATLCAAGHEAYAVELDVSSPASIDEAFGTIGQAFGRCDILVNNAGIAKTFPFLDYPIEHWRNVFDVNVTGPMLCGQHAARLMRKQGWGRIVNIASISGLRASSGRTAYGTSKAAVVGLTRQMAIELAEYGITTNGVAPGPIDTPMTLDLHSAVARENYTRAVPAKRYGVPEEIAAVVGFLCSEQASYVNGHTVPVDGGFMAAGVLEI